MQVYIYVYMSKSHIQPFIILMALFPSRGNGDLLSVVIQRSPHKTHLCRCKNVNLSPGNWTICEFILFKELSQYNHKTHKLQITLKTRVR